MNITLNLSINRDQILFFNALTIHQVPWVLAFHFGLGIEKIKIPRFYTDFEVADREKYFSAFMM